MLKDPIFCQQYRGANLGWRPEPDDIRIQQVGNVIYAHTTLVSEIFNNPPKHKFNLCTESGDLGLFDAGDKIIIGSNFCKNWFINKKDIPENLNLWFACHANIIHPKIRALPLGTNDTVIEKIGKILENPPPKDQLIYLNCRIDSNPQERMSAYICGHEMGWTLGHHPNYLDRIGRREYSNDTYQDLFLNEVARHRFTVSPIGSGTDCYRFWEILWLGGVPIIKTNQVMTRNWNLPILEVENWSDCTPEFLERQYEVIMKRGQNQEYDLDQLTRSFWTKQIEALN